MDEPTAEAPHSGTRPGLYDRIKTVLVVLAVGPPIGGLTFGLLLSAVTVLNDPQ